MVFYVVQYHHELLSYYLFNLSEITQCQLGLRKRRGVFHTMKTKNKQKRQTIINVAIRINTEVYEPAIPNYSEN